MIGGGGGMAGGGKRGMDKEWPAKRSVLTLIKQTKNKLKIKRKKSLRIR